MDLLYSIGSRLQVVVWSESDLHPRSATEAARSPRVCHAGAVCTSKLGAHCGMDHESADRDGNEPEQEQLGTTDRASWAQIMQQRIFGDGWMWGFG